MEEEKIEQEPIVTVGGESFPLSQSQTGTLGITKGEFRNLIIKIIKGTPSGSCSQRELLGLLLTRMGIRTHGKPREEYLRDYLICLRQMKEEGLVKFVSCKMSLHVRINQ